VVHPLRSGKPKKKAKVDRSEAKKSTMPKKLPAYRPGGQTSDVFGREKTSEDPLGNAQGRTVILVDALNNFQENCEHKSKI
jgi:hypothetical protein